MRKGSHPSPESLAKMRESKLGDKNPFFGKTHNAEARAKFSVVHKGKKLSDETKLKLSKSHTVDKIQCVCLQCGTIFEKRPSEVKRGEGKYCSRECSSLHRTGIPMPEEIRAKISASNKGKPKSEETRAKLSAARMGKFTAEQNPHYNKPVSEEAKAKLRAAMAGRKLSEDHKEKIRERVPRGEASPHWDGGKINRKCRQCGTIFLIKKSEIENGGGIYCSPKCKGKWMSKNIVGENHPLWKGGISFGKYCPKFNNLFKECVRKWFNYQCVECNTPQQNTKLLVHHVYYNKKSCCTETEDGKYIHTLPEGEIVEVIGDPNKFVTLCRSCHSKTNYNRLFWAKYFEEMINGWYEGKSYLTQDEYYQLN